MASKTGKIFYRTVMYICYIARDQAYRLKLVCF